MGLMEGEYQLRSPSDHYIYVDSTFNILLDTTKFSYVNASLPVHLSDANPVLVLVQA